MEPVNPHALVDTQWLHDHLDDDGVRVVDATFFLPNSDRDAGAEFAARHIPGAVFFDIDAVCDPATDLPHMLSSPDVFAAQVGALGLGSGHRIVAYDCFAGVSGAMRVWWTFRAFGYDNVAVLDGGLDRWIAEGRPLTGDVTEVRPATFDAGWRPELVRTFDQVRATVDNGDEQVVDMRRLGRFLGDDPEPRECRRFGHVPGSVNVPFVDLMEPVNPVSLRPGIEIKATFERAGVDLTRPIVTLCGSGVNAAVGAFALYLLGIEGVAVYDGSWAEWGNRDDAPIER